MLTDKAGATKEKKQKIAHIIAGIVILIHSFEKYNSGHGSYVFFAIAGLVFIAIALFHHTIAKKAPWIDGVFFVIEALLSLSIAYDYFHMGKKGLPAGYLIAGLIQLGVAYKLSKRGISRHKHAL